MKSQPIILLKLLSVAGVLCLIKSKQNCRSYRGKFRFSIDTGKPINLAKTVDIPRAAAKDSLVKPSHNLRKKDTDAHTKTT